MADEFHQAGLCGGGNYYWWNNTTPSAAVNMTDPVAVGNSSLDSTLQMLGLGVPSSDWSQPNHLLRGGYNVLQEEETSSCSISYHNHKDWNSPPKSFSSEEEDSSPSSFNNTPIMNTIASAAANNSYANTSLDPNQQQQDASIMPNSFLQQPAVAVDVDVASSLHFSNTPFWNSALTNNSFLLPPQSQFLTPSLLPTKTKAEQVRVARKDNTTTCTDQPTPKRPRMETPSPLPTFKVRKEKLGDRITALQQLVSPFGKTDTASVLHEAIEYIKFLHDQVSVLSTPYMKNGAPLQHQHQHQHQHQQASSHDHHNVMKEEEQDLRRRGLCLVPISSTFPVASESSPDFWAPTFGATFR